MDRQLQRGDTELIERTRVRTAPLATILEEYLPENQKIDLLNVDAEGNDLTVLKSNNWKKFRPVAILVEDYRLQTKNIEASAVYRYLTKQGYRMVSHMYDTTLYVNTEGDAPGTVFESDQKDISVRTPTNRYVALDEVLTNYEKARVLARQYPEWKILSDTLWSQLLAEQAANEALVQQMETEMNHMVQEVTMLTTENDALKERLANRQEQVNRLKTELNYSRTRVAESDAELNRINYALQTHTTRQPLIQSTGNRYLDRVITLFYMVVSFQFPGELKAYVQDRRAYRRMESSQLFNYEWYLKNNPGVAHMGVDPLWHYIRYGAYEGRNPSPTFNTNWYLRTYPEVALSGMNPLDHYIRFGQLEGRKTLPPPTNHITVSAQENTKNHKPGFSRKFTRLTDKDLVAQDMVERIVLKIGTYGFIDRAHRELESLTLATNTSESRQFAASELARWYTNQRNTDDSARALQKLDIVKELTDDSILNRKTTLMYAENLIRVGDVEAARDMLLRHLAYDQYIDIYLALVNTESDVNKRIEWINKGLEHHKITPIALRNIPDANHYYDRLTVNLESDAQRANQSSKVSIIMPVHNAQDIIATAIESILVQTWRNFELLIVDDCSDDGTRAVVQRYVEQDNRVQLLQTPTNSGPYVARNLALQIATGDFITTNDADDWSHPLKIEHQVQHLLNNPDIMANMSAQARLTNDIRFYRRGNYGAYAAKNYSSLMFRRDPVFTTLGYFDSVRFGADNEYFRRINTVFGEKAFKKISYVPLSFQRQTDTSLTGHSAFGYHGYHRGARFEYFRMQLYAKKHMTDFYYDFPQTNRPYFMLEPMNPVKEKRDANGRRQFDEVFAFDPRVNDHAMKFALEAAAENKKFGRRTAFIRLSHYDANPKVGIHETVYDFLMEAQNAVQLVVYGEKVACNRLIICDASLLKDRQEYLPDIDPYIVNILVSEAEVMDDEKPDQFERNLPAYSGNINYYFNMPGVWYGINEKAQTLLHQLHSSVTRKLKLSPISIIKHRAIKAEFVEQQNMVNKPEKTDGAPYVTRRNNLIYYNYIESLLHVITRQAKSMIDVGSNEIPLLEIFDWIPDRDALDLRAPYQSENVRGIKANFLEFEPEKKYDVATCLQVLEHIPDAGAFSQKLLEIADQIVISVPFKWPENSSKYHVQDPVDLDKVIGWFNREPDYYDIAVESHLKGKLKNKRLICYFDLRKTLD